MERARILIELGRGAQALTLLGNVISAEPHNAQAWCLTAQARLGIDDDAGALQAANTAVSLDPMNEWPHRLASIALDRLEQSDQALLAAREAVRLGPHSWAAFVRLTGASLRTRRMHDARVAVGHALALAPGEPMVHVMAGNVAMRAGETRQARAAFHRALQIDPQNADAHNAMGSLHLRQSSFGRSGNLAEAAEGFATALRADPTRHASRGHLDLTIRVFLGRLTYFVFLVAFLGDALRDSNLVLSRLGPPLLLAMPAAFGCLFVRRLSPDLRDYLSVSIRDRELRVPLVLGLSAVVLVLASSVSPHGARDVFAIVAAATAALCRIWLYLQMRRLGLTHGVPSRAVRFTTPVLSCIACGFALMAALLFSSARTPGAGEAGTATALLFVGGSLGTMWIIYRRRVAGRR